MNLFRDNEAAAKIEIFKQAPDMQAKRIEYTKNYKKSGDRTAVRRALKNLYEKTKKQPEKDLVAPILEAVESRATLQEVYDAMREATGFSIPE